MISSVAPTRKLTFYAYLITKIGNRNLKQGMCENTVREHSQRTQYCATSQPRTQGCLVFPSWNRKVENRKAPWVRGWPPAIIKTHMVVWLTGVEAARALMDIHSLMNNFENNQLDVKLVDICPDDIL